MNQPALLHHIIAGLVRRTWLVTIAAVIACAGFAATAVAAFVEASYLGPSRAAPPLAGGSGEAARAKAPTRHRSDGGALVERNMFFSTCAASVDGPGPADPFAPPRTP